MIISNNRRGLLTLAFHLIVLGCCCQEMAYKQYTVKDGLPGSIIYQSLQDRNGFIWFATNQGVSRFDGRTFTNYTKEDGLPDNDILKLYSDSHGNIWFVSLLGIPSVWHDNSIIRFDSCTGIRSICEDRSTDSIIFVKFDCDAGEDTCGYYQSVNRPGKWDFKPHFKGIMASFDTPILRGSVPGRVNVSFSWPDTLTQNLILQYNDCSRKYKFHSDFRRTAIAFGWPQYFCFDSHHNGIYFLSTDSLFYADVQGISSLLNLKDLGLNQTVKDDINYLFSDDDSTLWLCTRGKGIICIKNPNSPHHTLYRCFEKSFCTGITKDEEKGYWITTHNDGVFYLPNLSFYSLSCLPDLATRNARCIKLLHDGQIGAGFSDGNIVLIHQSRLDAHLIPGWAAHNKNNRILDLGSFGTHTLLAATDAGLLKISRTGKDRSMMPVCAIKGFYIAADTIINATAGGIYSVTNDGIQKGEVLMTRTTCISGFGTEHYFWGTLKGMYSSDKGVILNMGIKYPALSGFINHIDIAPDSVIWVSTGQGIVVLKKDMVQQITKEQGLASNICKHVSFDGNTCWVSTDKGIARIDYHWRGNRISYTLSNITEEDGLTANDVNQTVPAGKYIWAATTRGISFFSKDYVSRSTWSPLISITRIVADDSAVLAKDTISFGPKKARLLIEVSGISFRSGKDISYEYHLKELDTAWRRSPHNTIEFSALPYGNYTLEVRAVDRWGNKSNRFTRVFIRHPSPFWLAGWFIFSTYLLMPLTAGAGVYVYHRKRRLKREKDYQEKKKMQDLEVMALRAQMNPHFIFNCLTSIQFHIMKADVKSASAYLHKFSTLIRQTLQNSSASTILLRDEIKLLELYLDLEKLRLGDRMDYRIELSPDLDPDHQLIPAMIIQPYVENAIKHGIGPLEGVKGIVLLSFSKKGQYIECSIDDNGPGMGRSRYSSFLQENHQSMGTSITEKRIHTLNALQKEKIRIQIIDKQRSGALANGTLIQLYFPISNN